MLYSGAVKAQPRERALAVGARPSSLIVYRIIKAFLRRVIVPWIRAEAIGVEHLDRPGPLILAPVHRSNIDSVVLASFSSRRIRALAKDSLFRVPVLAWLVAALGAIPVRRGEADRDALVAAKDLLERGEAMIVFPEGGRQSGLEVEPLFTGTAWLAAKTGAKVVPIGIAGSEEALPFGSRRLRRSRVRIVVEEPLDPPVGVDARRVGREQLRAFTDELRHRLQAAQDRANALRDG